MYFVYSDNLFDVKYENTSLEAKGTLAHPLQHLTACLIQNGRRGLLIGQTLGYLTHKQLSQNKFFDSIIPSTRTLKTQNGHHAPQNGLWGLEMGVPLGFWALLSTFAK